MPKLCRSVQRQGSPNKVRSIDTEYVAWYLLMGRTGFEGAERMGFGILLRNSTEFKEQLAGYMRRLLSPYSIFFGVDCNQLHRLAKADNAVCFVESILVQGQIRSAVSVLWSEDLAAIFLLVPGEVCQ